MKHVLPKYWWSQQIHISWFIAWISVAFLLGIAIAPKTQGIFTDISWIVMGIILVVMVVRSRKRHMVFIVVIAGLLFGLTRGSTAYHSLAGYKSYYGKHVVVTGMVSEDTSYGPKGDLRLRVSAVRVDQHNLPGTMWVSSSDPAEIKRGDIVTLSGVVGEGFGNIPASMFKAKLVTIERPVPGDVGRRIRDKFGEGVSNAMPPEDANFAMAYLVGQKLSVSEALVDQLRTVGLIHAVVASGAQLTILVGVARRLFIKISKYLSTLFAGGMITGFILITGFSPSMTRAGLVSGLSIAAWYYGRVIHPLVLLPFSAAITAFIKPEYVWGDVGWYLSFAAFTGVILFAPLVHQYFWGKKKPSVVRELLVATFAAQLLTLPLVVHVFGYYSPYAIVANMLVVPLIPLTMLLTFISGIVGLIFPAIAIILGKSVSAILQYMTSVVAWIAHLPKAKTELDFGVLPLLLCYIGIVGITIFLWRSTSFDFREKKSEKLL